MDSTEPFPVGAIEAEVDHLPTDLFTLDWVQRPSGDWNTNNIGARGMRVVRIGGTWLGPMHEETNYGQWRGQFKGWWPWNPDQQGTSIKRPTKGWTILTEWKPVPTSTNVVSTDNQLSFDIYDGGSK